MPYWSVRVLVNDHYLLDCALSTMNGAVEKVRQRRARPLVGFTFTGLALFTPFALTYSVYAPGAKAPAALPVEWHVLACTGWAGEKVGLFEQPLFLLTLERIGQYSPI
ncbi:MAG: hypothetical protein V3U07_03270 [Nitrospirales bacterium]|jgi:hypothetical protein